jgi:hypothetical protein
MVFCVVCLWSDSEIGQIWMNLFDRVKVNFFCLHIYCLSASVQYSFLFYSFGCFNNIIYNQTTRKGELTIFYFIFHLVQTSSIYFINLVQLIHNIQTTVTTHQMIVKRKIFSFFLEEIFFSFFLTGN